MPVESAKVVECIDTLIRHAHTFDYSKVLGVENRLSSLECRY